MDRYITGVGLCLTLLLWSAPGLAQRRDARDARDARDDVPWWCALLPTLTLEYQRQLQPTASEWRITETSLTVTGAAPTRSAAQRWAVLLSWQIYPTMTTTSAEVER